MRFGVVGAGVIGQLRARTVKEHPRAELLGVMDPDSGAAERAVQGSRARAVSRVEDLLAMSPDAVIVSSPLPFHEETCLQAFASGAHVICEKPLASTVEACRSIVSAAAEHERILAVGFNHRFYPSMKFIRKVIDEGRIGTVNHLRVFGGHDGLSNFRADWQYKAPESGGGAMMDVGIHMTDLARYFLGEVTEVYGVMSNSVWNVPGSEDNAVAILRSPDGIPATYLATWDEWRGYGFYVEAYGDKGMVRGFYAPMQNLLITQEEPGAPRHTKRLFYPQIMIREKLKSWTSTALESFREELGDFFRMVGGEGPVTLADGNAGLRAVEIAAAVRESTETGKSVSLEPLGAASS